MKTESKAVIAVYIISSVLILHMVTGALLTYIFKAYGATVDTNTIILVMTLPSLVGIVGTIAAGPLAMVLNKKMMLLVCAGLLFAYFAMLALVGPNGPFWVLLLAAVFAGICQGGSVTLTSLIIGEFSPPEKRAPRMARSGAIMNIGAAVINIVGGMIASGNDGADWPKAYYLGVIIIPAMILFFILMPSKSPAVPTEAEHVAAEAAAGTPPSTARTLIRVVLMDLAIMLAAVAYAAFILNVSTHIVDVYALGDSSHAGIANAISTVAGVAAGFTLPIWIKLFKNWLVVVGYAVIALGLVFMGAMTTSLVGIFICGALVGFGLNMASPYAISVIMGVTPAKFVPIAVSLFIGAINLGIFLAPYIHKVISMPFGGGHAGMVWSSATLAAVVAVASIFLYVTLKKPSAPAPSASEPSPVAA